ncbi:MAG: HYR domain-containing protein, partial [Lysobacteraceae bacterium]
VTLLTDIPAAPTCNGGPITVTRIYSITDCSGNSSTVTQTINVADVTAPTISSIPSNVTVGCANLVPAVNTLAVVASDNCNSILTVTSNDVITPGSCANRYSIARTYTVTDCSGNSTSSTQTITVNDITGPILIAPATQTLNVGSGVGCSVPMPDYISLVSATATDACGAGVITYQQLAPNAPGSLVIGYGGTRTIVIVATDACGNTSTTSFLLNLVDQTAPTAICKSITVNLSSTTGAGTVSITPAMVNNGSTDNCSAVTLVSVVPSTLTCANVGTNTVTLTVRDDSGNTSTCTSTVTVNDITAPSIVCNAPITTTTGVGNTQCGAVVTYTAPTVTDNCSGATTVQTTGLASGSLFPVGVTTNTFVATDASGNTASCSFTVTVTDNTAPIIVCNAPIVTTTGAGNTQCGRVVTYTAPIGTDNCSGATTAQTAGLASGSLFPLGITTNTFVTTDVAGNTATCSFTVTVTDNTAPIAICKSITVNLSSTPGAGTVSITPAMVNDGSFDNCSPVTLVSVVPSTFTCANVGPNTVTLTVSDAAGNTSTCTSIVTVKDITAPVVTCFGDTTIFKGTICTNTLTDLTGRVNATDNCSIVSVTQSVPVGTVIGASIANLPITLTVTDASGNTSSCTFNVHFVDNTPAVISGCPASFTVNTSVGNTACSQVATWITPTASDNCNDLGLPTLVSTHNSGDAFPVGATTVTYTATDAAGNTSTCSFVVTVVDNTSPVITGCPSTVNVNTGAGNTACSQTATWTAPTSFDNCGIQSFASTHLPGATFPVGTTVVTYTAIDIHGNSSTCSFNVIVTDNTAPLLTCNAPITTTTGAGNTQCGAIVTYTAPVGTDNCSGATTAQTAGLPSGSLFPVGVTTNTFVTTDAAGNTATCSFTVTVTDDTAPL